MGSAITSNSKGLREILLVLLVVSLIVDHEIAEGRRLSSEQYLKLKKHLEFLNRPAVKSIQTNYGVTFDCVDIYKQPAFDHPLLKNSTIQMKPSSLPLGMNIEASTDKIQFEKFDNESCPLGTIPIRRTQMEDLLRFDSPPDFGKKIRTADQSEHNYGVLKMKGSNQYYGTHANLNLWQPEISKDDRRRFSLSQVWVLKGSGYQFNTIEAGWHVFPQLYGDSYPHVFVYWTADNYGSTGCYNLYCSGFVQVNPSFRVGSILSPVSVYGGAQQVFDVRVFKDLRTGNWWFFHGSDSVGYWDRKIFTSLADGPAERIDWGGEVATFPPSDSPPMGSGHYPEEGFGKASSTTNIKVVVNNPGGLQYVDPPVDCCFPLNDRSDCYRVKDLGIVNDNIGRAILFGGPGGCHI